MSIVTHAFDSQQVLDYIQLVYSQPSLEVIETSILPFRIIDKALSVRLNDRDSDGKLKPQYLNKFWIGTKVDPAILAVVKDNPEDFPLTTLIYGDLPRKLAWLEQQSKIGNTVYLVANGRNQGSLAKYINRGWTFHYESDDKRTKEEKLTDWQTLGLPKPSTQLWTGSKSIHNGMTFSDLPAEGIDINELYEIATQFKRRTGSDGFAATNDLKNFKVQTYRLPGFTNFSTGNFSKFINIYESHSFAAIADQMLQKPLGRYNTSNGLSTAVPNFDDVKSDTWRDRFSSYKSLSQEAVEESEAKNTALQARLDRQAAAPKYNPAEVNKKLKQVAIEGMSLLNLVSPKICEEILEGSPDGTGRSHVRAFAIASTLCEWESLCQSSAVVLTDEARVIFSEWVARTFQPTEAAKIKASWGVFARAAKNPNPKAEQLDYLETVLNNRASKAVGTQLLTRYNSGKPAEFLIEEADRFLAHEKVEGLDIKLLPVMFNDKNLKWSKLVDLARKSRLVTITGCKAFARQVVEDRNAWTILVTDETPKVLLHKLAQLCQDKDFKLCLHMDAPQSDRLLAEKLRTGFFSKGIVASNVAPKPEVVVIDAKQNIWGASYYWHSQSEQVANLVESKVLLGYAGESKYVSELVAKVATKAKTYKLVALVAEMGTGKTESFTREITNWGRRFLSISHRELLAHQSATRLNLIDYKEKSEADIVTGVKTEKSDQAARYERAKVKGLATTIDTLVQGGNSKAGYLPGFKTEDWLDACVVIDEAESFMKYLMESSTLADSRQAAIDFFIDLIGAISKNGGQIILSDANLKTSTIRFFEKIIAAANGIPYRPGSKSALYNCYTIVNTYKKLNNRQLKVVSSLDQSVSEMVNHAENEGKKCIFFTDTKNASKRNYAATQSLGLYLRSKGFGHVIDADTRCFSDDQDHKLLDTLMAIIKSSPICIIAISPVIDSGTDWNNLGVDEVWASYSGIMGLDNTLQQIERIRDDVNEAGEVIPRIIYAKRRAAPSMGLAEINNLESTFREIIESYASTRDKLAQTWSEYQVMATDEIQARLKALFPEMNPHILSWWKNSLLDNYYAAQEFRMNLVAKMVDKGYVAEYVEYSVNSELIDTLKEYGEAQQYCKQVEIATANLDLEIETNADTMPRSHSRVIDLKACLSGMGLIPDQWKGSFSTDEQLELIKRTLGKRTKVKRKLIIGFATLCHLVGENEDISEIVSWTEDLRNALLSAKRTINNIPLAIKPCLEFLVDTLQIKNLITKCASEAVKRGICADQRFRLWLHNKQPHIKAAHKILVEHKDMIKKYFDFVVSDKEEMAANNVRKLLVGLGFNSESKKLRDSDQGADKDGGNKRCNIFIIEEDTLHKRIWSCWIGQAESKTSQFFKGYFNPSDEEGGDTLWKLKYGIRDVGETIYDPLNTLEALTTQKKQLFNERCKQMELVLTTV